MNSQIKQQTVLLVDDEIQILRSYEMTLRMEGYTRVISNQDSRETLAAFKKSQPSLVLLDLTMPHVSGEELLKDIKADSPQTPVVIITGNDAVETAVDCMKNGAEDYLVKPVSKDRLLRTVERVLASNEWRKHVQLLERKVKSPQLENPEAFSEIVTNHYKMLSLFRYAETIADSSEPVLIVGDTGVGKELMAQAIYKAGGSRGEFVAVNIAGVNEQVFDDTLFGHIKGAFTGAEKSRAGLVEKASGGTLFLDEIGDLPMESQVKLLRLIQEGEYFPLGQDIPKSADIRIVAATNQPLQTRCEAGTFRKDLFFRLNTHNIALPPLSERACDIPLLVEVFLQEATKSRPDAVELEFETILPDLVAYAFPGNVRELRSMVFDAVASGSLDVLAERLGTNREKCLLQPLPEVCRDQQQGQLAFPQSLPTMEDAKDMLIEEALRRSGGNKTMAAKLLGMTRQALNKRLRKNEV